MRVSLKNVLRCPPAKDAVIKPKKVTTKLWLKALSLFEGCVFSARKSPSAVALILRPNPFMTTNKAIEGRFVKATIRTMETDIRMQLR